MAGKWIHVQLFPQLMTSTAKDIKWLFISWYLVSNIFCPSVNGEGNMCEVTTNENFTDEIKVMIAEKFADERVSYSLYRINEGIKVKVAELNFVQTGYQCKPYAGYKCQQLNNYTFIFTSPWAFIKADYRVADDEDQSTLCTFKDHTLETQPYDASEHVSEINVDVRYLDETSESNPNTNIDRGAGSDEKYTIAQPFILCFGLCIAFLAPGMM